MDDDVKNEFDNLGKLLQEKFDNIENCFNTFKDSHEKEAKPIRRMMTDHQVAIYGEKGQGGLVRCVAIIKEKLKTVSGLVWKVIGVGITLFTAVITYVVFGRK